MGPLRKPDGSEAAEVSSVSSRRPPPEAFEYEDDVKPEVVKTLQEKADITLSKEEWVVIDGYVGESD